MDKDTPPSVQKPNRLWLLPVFIGFLFIAIISVFVLLVNSAPQPHPAAGAPVYAQVYCNLVLMITGTTGKAIGTLLVLLSFIAVFIRWLRKSPGLREWVYTALSTIIMVSLVLGAAGIILALGGTGTACLAD